MEHINMLETQQKRIIRSIQKSISISPWLPIFTASILIGILLSIFFSRTFLTVTNFRNILVQASFTSIISIGLTFVIMTNGIDISVSMNVFLMMAIMYQFHEKFAYSPWTCFIIAIISSALVGTWNAFLVCVLNIPPMIATFATFSIARGAGLYLINMSTKQIGAPLRVFGGQLFDFIPIPIVIALFMAMVGGYLHKKTIFGRHILAVGNSTISAKESGINVNRVRFFAYVIAGLCSGLASLVFIGRHGVVTTDAAFGVEFTVITAVVLGGTKLTGGYGSVVGSVIGCIFLILVQNALSFFEVSVFSYDMVRGIFLLSAVILEYISTAQQKKSVFALRAERIKAFSDK
jgi:ribose transport system permease protein